MSSLQAVRIIQTQIGKVAVGATDQGICDIEILVSEKSRGEFSDSEQATRHADQAASELQEYFNGTRKNFEVALDISGTQFQQSVWAEIRKVGFGDDSSYGTIAKNLNNPNASRAVGGAVGANPVPLIIGCHRVLGSNRKLTGYSGGEGLKTKLWLLDHERIAYQ